jgi:hypothetical protein
MLVSTSAKRLVYGVYTSTRNRDLSDHSTSLMIRVVLIRDKEKSPIAEKQFFVQNKAM